MKKLAIVKNPANGFVVEILNPGRVDGTVCNPEAQVLKENSTDGAVEKHVPVLEESGHGILVKVGVTPHPSTEEHYIEFIEVINGDYVNRKFLKPGDAPEAQFYVPKQSGLILRAYCNLHGLWKAEI